VLDEVEMPQAAFAAKQEAVRKMESFQLEIAAFAATLPLSEQQPFELTLAAAVAQAAQQARPAISPF
jgi:hypothetical protein